MQAGQLQNSGRLVNFINGITGVAAGGNAVVNLPVNQRYHRLVFQCAAVNYTGGTGKAITKITGSGVSATGTLTVVNGVPTAIAIVAGGSGWTVGDTFTIADDTGTGFVGTVATVTGGPPGALATATVTVGGTASAVDPATLISSMKLLVNGVNMRDIDVAQILRINGANPIIGSAQTSGAGRRGELAIYFTPPWRNINQQNEISSWDLFGQSTFQLQIGISSTVTLPSLIGVQEFDYMRNVMPDGKGGVVPFLQPVAQHQFSWPIVAGRNDINTLPYDYPISRMWLLGSVAGSISQVEVFQDGNKVLESTIEQLKQAYTEYGFNFGQAGYFNSGYAGTSALIAGYNPPRSFDAAFIADPDQRYWKALKCANSMILRVYSDVAQTLTIVQETMPGSYTS